MKRQYRATITDEHGHKRRVYILDDISGGGYYALTTGNYVTQTYGDGYVDIEKYLASSDSWRMIHNHVYLHRRAI